MYIVIYIVIQIALQYHIKCNYRDKMVLVHLEVLMDKRLILLLLAIILILTSCSHPDPTEKYIHLCELNKFSQQDLKDIIGGLSSFDWAKYREYEDKTYEKKLGKFIGVFWRLRDYKNYDKVTIKQILLIANDKGIDGGLSEEYSSLIDFLYQNENYKSIIENLQTEDKRIDNTIKNYLLNN